MRESKSTFRVYYEDTDIGGVVYHANYLKFFERGRTDYLKNRGFALQDLLIQEGLHFVVRDLKIAYNKPARLDNDIVVTTKLSKLGKAKLSFEQYITLKNDDDTQLCQAEVLIGCLDRAFKPSRLPERMLKEL